MSSSIIKSDNGVTSGVTGIVQTAGSDGTLQLQTTTSGGTATTALTIDNNQKVTFANTIGFGSNAGITFNNSSATTNSLLNDYETGTFLPYIYFGTTQQPVGNYQNATYVKVGKFVSVFGICSVGTKSGSGYVYITLPFNSANSSGLYGTGAIGILSGITIPGGGYVLSTEIGSNVSKATLFYSSSTGSTPLTDTTFSNLGYLEFSFTYPASF